MDQASLLLSKQLRGEYPAQDDQPCMCLDMTEPHLAVRDRCTSTPEV